MFSFTPRLRSLCWHSEPTTSRRTWRSTTITSQTSGNNLPVDMLASRRYRTLIRHTAFRIAAAPSGIARLSGPKSSGRASEGSGSQDAAAGDQTQQQDGRRHQEGSQEIHASRLPRVMKWQHQVPGHLSVVCLFVWWQWLATNSWMDISSGGYDRKNNNIPPGISCFCVCIFFRRRPDALFGPLQPGPVQVVWGDGDHQHGKPRIIIHLNGN